MLKMNTQQIIEFISTSEKKTPVKVYIKGDLSSIDFGRQIKAFVETNTGVLFGDWGDIEPILNINTSKINDYIVENDRRNSAIPLLDLKGVNARIEPGAVIRDQVEIGNNVVIMMGATINIGAVIGDDTMIDMNTVIGGRVQIGERCHIGAGSVIAGVIEPPSANPVVIEDDVLVGANAVILEGVHVGRGSVVAAGAVVVNDVASYTVVAGVPAKEIKKVDSKTINKTKLMKELRHLNGD